MARLLNVHYIDTIFSNEFEIRSYFERCYNYAYEALLEINEKQSLFISASIATRNSIKEKLIEAKNIDARAIASFVYHFFTFLCGFDISISPTNALYGYLSPIDLSKSTLIVSLGEAFLNGQLDDVKKENVKIDFYDLLLSAESDILETLLYDIDKHKGDFFVTFRNADLPYNPMLEGQFPKEFKGKNMYSLAAKNINSLSYAKNEKRAILNTSLSMINQYFDILGNSLAKNPYLKGI